jgi:hypothetical protein
MSYILDALKKIEHEKSKKPALDGKISISGDLFHERKRLPARAGIWKIAAIIAVALLIAGGGTWFMLSGNSNKNVSAIRPDAPAPVIPVKTSTTVSTPIKAASTAVAAPSAAPIPVASVSDNRTETIEAEDEDSSRRVRRRDRPPKVHSISPQTPLQTVQTPSDIKLSGIAWQDERAGRRAVINGFLLKEGAVVSGAKITDIYANRVRFASPAGQFEIKLDALLPAEAKK